MSNYYFELIKTERWFRCLRVLILRIFISNWHISVMKRTATYALWKIIAPAKLFNSLKDFSLVKLYANGKVMKKSLLYFDAHQRQAPLLSHEILQRSTLIKVPVLMATVLQCCYIHVHFFQWSSISFFFFWFSIFHYIFYVK